jgi:BlaI family transcriptional regulator, penicillinase repressor
MNKTVTHRLGDLQLRILKVVWARREATVAEVYDGLEGPSVLAYTTVATMLRKMEVRGLVEHRVEGRSFIYRACVAENDVGLGMAEHVLDRLFDGSLADMMSHLLTAREVDPGELSRLFRLITEHKRKK